MLREWRIDSDPVSTSSLRESHEGLLAEENTVPKSRPGLRGVLLPTSEHVLDAGILTARFPTHAGVAAPSPDGCLCYIVEVMVRDSGGQTERRAAASSSMLSVMLSISRSEQVEMDGQQRLDRLRQNGSKVFALKQIGENARVRE